VPGLLKRNDESVQRLSPTSRSRPGGSAGVRLAGPDSAVLISSGMLDGAAVCSWPLCQGRSMQPIDWECVRIVGFSLSTVSSVAIAFASSGVRPYTERRIRALYEQRMRCCGEGPRLRAVVRRVHRVAQAALGPMYTTVGQLLGKHRRSALCNGSHPMYQLSSAGWSPMAALRVQHEQERPFEQFCSGDFSSSACKCRQIPCPARLGKAGRLIVRRLAMRATSALHTRSPKV